MSHGHGPVDPKSAPVPWKSRAGNSPDIAHHQREWTSGTQGGGKVPADFEWNSNPKQSQEERGAPGLTPPSKR